MLFYRAGAGQVGIEEELSACQRRRSGRHGDGVRKGDEEQVLDRLQAAYDHRPGPLRRSKFVCR